MITNEQTLELLKDNHDWDFGKENSHEEFIAKLYSYEQKLFKNHWHKENLNTIMLENAIWLINIEDIFAMIKFIMDELHKIDFKTTFKDRAILHAIHNSDSRHNMDYYFARGNEFTRRFGLEISEHTRLTKEKRKYFNTGSNLVNAFLVGMDTYSPHSLIEIPVTKNDCPYTDENLKEAWLNGYCWFELQSILFNALLKI